MSAITAADEPGSMMESGAVAAFLDAVRRWAATQAEIETIALVGSWARGTARPDSDVDLVLVCDRPERYREDEGWLGGFGAVRSASLEDWGLVRAWRVFYADGLEVEFGLTDRRWLGTDPIDPGTAGVVGDGVRVLLDRRGMLGRLIAAVRDGSGAVP